MDAPLPVALHWRGGTRYHDWAAEGGAIPLAMLRRAHESGVIGEVEWVSSGPTDREIRANGFSALETLLRKPVKPGQSARVAAGGSLPAPWSAALLLMPFDHERGEVDGYNLLSLSFDGTRWEGNTASDSLAKLFRDVHTPAETETAFIHPHPRWAELSSPAGGEYGTPVTFAPFFSGVFWTTFLGPKHLGLFDAGLTKSLDAYEVESSNGGVYLRVTRDVADAISAETEAEMFRLTELFRKEML